MWAGCGLLQSEFACATCYLKPIATHSSKSESHPYSGHSVQSLKLASVDSCLYKITIALVVHSVDRAGFGNSRRTVVPTPSVLVTEILPP